MRPTQRLLFVGIAVVVAAMLLAGCVPGPNPFVAPTDAHEPAGFWLGLWHGFVVWVSFFWSLFDKSVSVYEVHNNGWPYNLGFVIGAACMHGGGAWGGCRRRRN
jgi:hypothetical protein